MYVIGLYVIAKGELRSLLLILYLDCNFILETTGDVSLPYIGLI